jgi:hypothetical protein
MLEALRFFVNFVPRVVEDIVQEAFEQPMMANDFKGALSARWRKAYPVVLLITHE